MPSQQYTPEFFKTDLAESYASALQIVPRVLEFMTVRAVLDVGCGTGHFLRAFREYGVTDIFGVDGDYVPKDALVIDPISFRAADLTKPLSIGRRFDLVLSLEVAEHLPEASAGHFVDQLTAHGPVVLFSAAVPGQGGTGHINEQWPSYWIEKFNARGYRALDILRPALWADDKIAWWYRQNCMFFADEQACTENPRFAEEALSGARPLDLIHPDLYSLHTYKSALTEKQLSELLKYLAPGGLFSVARKSDGTLKIDKA
jgi:SAM-dependent methyltransferase